MNISRVITFLVAGVFIGAILFFAGFGVLNLFKSDPNTPVVAAEGQIEKATQPATIPPPQAVPVNPPKIEVTSSQTDSDNSVALLEGQGTSNSPFKIKPLDNVDSSSSGNPDDEIQTVAFGTLTLSTVSTENNTPVNADFLIQNSDGMAIALVKDTSTSTLSLPVGDYKITVSQGPEKVVRFLGVKDGRNGSEVFELNVPALTGEAPAPVIAGADTDAPIPVPATTTASVANVATSNQPAATPAAQDDSTTEPPVENPTTEVTTNTSTDEAKTDTEATGDAEPTSTVAVAPTTDTTSPASSADTATASQATATNSSDSNSSSGAIGGLRLSALTKQGKRPTTASFYIQKLNGQNVETFRNVKTQQLTLPAGKYKITVKTAKTSQVKEVEVLATRGVHEIFLISDQAGTSQSSTTSSAAAATQNEQASSTSNPSSTTSADSSSSTDEKDAKKAKGKLELFAQKASNNSAVKSNFYVQMPNGTMVASKIYVDSIGYKLPEGKYKVIVRANGYKNKSITLNVRAGQARREIFKLESTRPAATQNNSSSSSSVRPTVPAATTQPTRAAQQAPSAPASPAQNTARAFGGLTVNIVSQSDGAGLAADIVITQRDGTPLKQVSGVSSASFDLPPREFLIRVTSGGITTSNPVKIIAGKLAIKTISFDTTRLSRQERRRLRRQERRERSQ